jgi:signal transduction histidine kinase
MNYTPSGGSITIEAAAIERGGKRGAALSIQDTGPGIKPEEMPRLFERFYRGSAARTSAVPGTGLGLAIAQEIVERHGGYLDVTSTGIVGEGARFTIWLPGEQIARPDVDARKPRPAVPGLDIEDDHVAAR